MHCMPLLPQVLGFERWQPKQLTEVSLEADAEQKMKVGFLKTPVVRSPSAYSRHPSGLYP